MRSKSRGTLYLNGSLVRVALHACLSRCGCLWGGVLSNLAALSHLQRKVVSDYSPISPIENSDTVQDVQVQADLGGRYIDRTSLQMHRRGGRWTQKACNSMSAPSSKPPLSRSSSSPSV